MKIAIIKYNAGNTQSVIFALNRLGIEPILTEDFEELKSADKVIFPGVGEASTTMKHLKELHLNELIPDLKQPVLGICLGMQLMCNHSEENDTDCLGIFDAPVVKFKSEDYKIPHMGWNNLVEADNELFRTLPDDHMYFVHSYYVPVSEYTIAKTDYINNFSAAIKKDNFYAVQFHPEKSGAQGAQILKNFIEL
ncbi:imidazole glycerol phosphate synthase subunit HisH [Fulvivirga lutimaris]|uniref:imidazole glycerol phosphate synthase subunit HisH n=1 Tax=Fulvivirga lutimaris TaxID=1819566 RepID=UPI0012BB64F3|nr:imidazole glycerol phosphate synthase subunit HisH [Fulvivirga lutimaris]MTI41570.1 imidazole glycerol phosphate synthase subunit HisH [Fulvivirga lutimaris]